MSEYDVIFSERWSEDSFDNYPPEAVDTRSMTKIAESNYPARLLEKHEIDAILGARGPSIQYWWPSIALEFKLACVNDEHNLTYFCELLNDSWVMKCDGIIRGYFTPLRTVVDFNIVSALIAQAFNTMDSIYVDSTTVHKVVKALRQNHD